MCFKIRTISLLPKNLDRFPISVPDGSMGSIDKKKKKPLLLLAYPSYGSWGQSTGAPMAQHPWSSKGKRVLLKCPEVADWWCWVPQNSNQNPRALSNF